MTPDPPRALPPQEDEAHWTRLARPAWPQASQGRLTVSPPHEREHARLFKRFVERFQALAPPLPEAARLDDKTLWILRDQALLELCREDRRFSQLFFYFELQRRGYQFFRLGSWPPESSFVEQARHMIDLAYQRKRLGARLAEDYDRYVRTQIAGSPSEPPASFRIWRRALILNAFTELQRTARHGDDFWKHFEPFPEPKDRETASASVENPQLEQAREKWVDGFEQLVRLGRAGEARRMLELLRQKIEAYADPQRREALLEWLRSLEDASAPALRELADQLNIPEARLHTWIHRVKEKLREEHPDTIARIFSGTHEHKQEEPS